MTTAATWVMRVLWLSLPFTLGEAIADAFDGRSRPVELTGTLGSWVLWALVFVAMSVPRVETLIPMRVGTAGGAVIGVAIAMANDLTAAGVIGVTTCTICAVIASTSLVGDRFIDGSSYGNERRVALRTPTLYALIFVPLAFGVLIAAIVTGPLLLASEQWVLGAVAVVLGAGAGWISARALHALSQRWLVFVPAGLVIHDHLCLVEPVLVRRAVATSIGPCPSETDAIDLTASATGLALLIEFDPPVAMNLSGQPGGIRELSSVIVTPSLAALTLREATKRGFRTA
ncbi:MAG: hypothetical protein IH940_02720 [Acidobacteria bacterium]|nr:hypothetical protein [Acidobacteriota bacterium]